MRDHKVRTYFLPVVWKDARIEQAHAGSWRRHMKVHRLDVCGCQFIHLCADPIATAKWRTNIYVANIAWMISNTEVFLRWKLYHFDAGPLQRSQLGVRAPELKKRQASKTNDVTAPAASIAQPAANSSAQVFYAVYQSTPHIKPSWSGPKTYPARVRNHDWCNVKLAVWLYTELCLPEPIIKLLGTKLFCLSSISAQWIYSSRQTVVISVAALWMANLPVRLRTMLIAQLYWPWTMLTDRHILSCPLISL